MFDCANNHSAMFRKAEHVLGVNGTMQEQVMDNLGFLARGGTFHLQCYDKDGNLKWQEDAKNAVVTAGLNKLLDILFDAVTSKITTWHLGVSSDNTAISGSYSLASEVGTRQPTTFTRTSQTCASDEESFTGIDATVRKVFVITASSSGTLIAVSDLSTPRTMVSSDVLKCTYSLSAAAA